MNSFYDIHWYRLSCELINIRSSNVQSHPFLIFQAIIKGVTQSIDCNNQSAIFFHIKNKKHTFKIRESDIVCLDIFFCRTDVVYVNKWKEAFVNYLSHSDTVRNFDILKCGDIEERNFDKLINEIGEINSEGEICIEFLTPLPFKLIKNKNRTYLDKNTLIKCFENRFSKLSGREILYDPSGDNFTILPYYWKYTEIRHSSKSQPGEVQYVNGTIGNL